jgi:hypothetical protein
MNMLDSFRTISKFCDITTGYCVLLLLLKEPGGMRE